MDTKVKVLGLRKDIKRTQFMQACDVFESFKVLYAGSTDFDLTCADIEEGELVEQFIAQVRKEAAAGDELYSSYIALFVPERGDLPSWVDPTVKQLSTGHKWTMFDAALKQLKYIPHEG